MNYNSAMHRRRHHRRLHQTIYDIYVCLWVGGGETKMRVWSVFVVFQPGKFTTTKATHALCQQYTIAAI